MDDPNDCNDSGNLPNGHSEIKWNGATFAAKALLAFCRRLPAFRGKRLLYETTGAVVFRNELPLLSNGNVRLTVDPRDYLGRTLAFEGDYEPKSLMLALSLMSTGGVVVDVGCNAGMYTLSLGSLPGVRVVSIDASYLALSRLHNNLRGNPKVNAQVVNCALSSGNSMVSFGLPFKTNLGSMKVMNQSDENCALKFWAATVRLQDVLDSLGSGKVKLLKMDVEGFELDVCKGLDFGGRFRPENMILECSPEFRDRAVECFNFLVNKGFEAMNVEGMPISNIDDLLENNVWMRGV
jgi:FkbM family methyltransferase